MVYVRNMILNDSTMTNKNSQCCTEVTVCQDDCPVRSLVYKFKNIPC